jgi:hypothetical protein
MPGTPTSSTPLPAQMASAECSSGSGGNTIMAVLDRLVRVVVMFFDLIFNIIV